MPYNYLKFLSGNDFPIWFFLIAMGFIYSCHQKDESDIEAYEGMKLWDERLELSLLAEDPEIVTPIGIAIDSQDRIFVLESHTHLPPKGYSGPPGDLIKVFEDSNGDGQMDAVTVFAEGIKEGLNLAFSPEGNLYVVTSKEVWVYYDRDEDGRSDDRRKLLALTEPEQVYAHAALLSIAFSTDGWMYIGRGNTGGVGWVCEGSDASQVNGYGDGGNIMRARLDGSQLEEYATGFWNPFDLKFDAYGRLMAADNDPDSRGPNRLLHVVKGGDYGYKSIFGGSGIHPYSAWNGELPGTLPYAVALGEAPSGLLNANLTSLPLDYQNQMLCSIWEESSIVRIDFQEEGVSVSGNAEVILEGGENFRPVAFAADSKGNIYFTDWVLRDYPNHGKGKVWKLSTKSNVETLKKRAMFDPVVGQDQSVPSFLTSSSEYVDLKEKLKSGDPFVLHATVMALSKGNFIKDMIIDAGDADPDLRLGILLAVQKSENPEVEYLIERFLADPDPRIRNMALIWAGSSQMGDRVQDLEKAITSGEASITLFETYLETVKLLQPEFMDTYRSRKVANSKTLKRTLPDNFISSIVSEPLQPSQIRKFALRFLEDLSNHRELLQKFLKPGNEDDIRLEVIWTLKNFPDKELADQILHIALEKENPTLLRSEALSILSTQPGVDFKRIIPLLEDKEENIQIEAARYLRPRIDQGEVREAFEEHWEKLDSNNTSPLKQQLELGLQREGMKRPENTSQKEWQALLDGTGDVDRGRRVFYSTSSLCSSCHSVDGMGGDLGPDLSQVGRSKDRNQLISSIIMPSVELSPEWQGWYIQMEDGTRYQGRQIDVGSSQIKLYTEDKGFVTLEQENISDYGLIPESLMPEGLHRNLTDQDLRDLLAYLQLDKE